MYFVVFKRLLGVLLVLLYSIAVLAYTDFSERLRPFQLFLVN